jgi:biotin carboxylase
MTRVLLLASTRAYHTDDFIQAAKRLGIELVLGTDRCHRLAEVWPEGAISLDFRDPDAAAATIAEHARAAPIAGIVPTDETTAIIAARAAALLGLRANPRAAVEAAGNKLRFRQALSAAGLAQPAFVTVDASAHIRPEAARAGVAYPVVVKPLHLSASRGVMRADSDDELAERMARLAALLRDPEVTARDPLAARLMLIESFVPGPEVAYEGLLVRGRLSTLAIFDKPDPLDGPFFAETIYVTPSVKPAEMRDAIAREVAAAARAIGLEEGPVHAELRLSGSGPSNRPRHGASPGDASFRRGGPVVLELAARAIGGLCTRTLRFGAGISLEELLLGHAAGRDVSELLARETGASGVYMLPVPEHGVVREIHGVDQAMAVPGVRDVVITVRPGEVVVPLPEGNAYMGFVFAAGHETGAVVAALRRAAALIRFRIAPRL